jgi:7-cyano-7-deazaguanine synthase
MKLKKGVLVVLSGGQDSTTTLYWAKDQFETVRAITFDYGQRHRIEIESAKKVAEMAEVPWELVKVEGLLRSTSPLTSSNPLEKYESYEQMDKVIGDRVELTFVPMRNTLFLTVAANYALSYGFNHIATGVCQEDNANYPDCTEKYVTKLQTAFQESLRADFWINTPLMHYSKAQTVELARRLPGCWEALAYSHTSYDGKYPPTDNNHANVLRAQGFLEAGFPDPLVLRAWKEGLMELPTTPNYDSYRAQTC